MLHLISSNLEQSLIGGHLDVHWDEVWYGRDVLNISQVFELKKNVRQKSDPSILVCYKMCLNNSLEDR